MENITKKEMQSIALDMVEKMMTAEDALTFKNVLDSLNEKMSAMPKPPRHTESFYVYSMRFWRDHLAEWMDWKFVHGHPLEIRWITQQVKSSYCKYIDDSDLPGEKYARHELDRIISSAPSAAFRIM